MASTLKVGVVGCGNISKTYFEFSPLFKGMEITACADINKKAAAAAAENYNVEAMEPSALIKSKKVDIVLNLTVPDQHFVISLAAVKAGKHVYSEKPLTLSLKDGLKLQALAAAKGRGLGHHADQTRSTVLTMRITAGSDQDRVRRRDQVQTRWDGAPHCAITPTLALTNCNFRIDDAGCA